MIISCYWTKYTIIINDIFVRKTVRKQRKYKKISLESGLKPTLSRLEVWQGYKDSNLGHAVLETADKILCNPHEYYVFGQGD